MMSDNPVLSVRQLSDILKGCFENPAFSNLAVYGEVYSVRLGKFSYIEIGDQGNRQTTSPIVKCAFSTFYGADYHLEDIKVGDVIQVRGSLTYYPHGCSLTLWGKSVEILKSQLGKNLLLKQKTLEKLDKLGYLNPERKRKIPRFVRKVAILTAETGAAYQDILKTLHDRFPVDSVLYPIVAQGDGAAKTIVTQMARAARSDCDVIILGRGGGSKTDLSCFDDELVAMSIAESPKPVITCIGHTIDTAIADRVSDVMAITPTEGASLINPSLADIHEELDGFRASLEDAFLARLNEKNLNRLSFVKALEALSPKRKIALAYEKEKAYQDKLDQRYRMLLARKAMALTDFDNRLTMTLSQILSGKQQKLTAFEASLSTFDPGLFAKKGYALIYDKNHKKITGARDLKAGETITITYPDGRKEAEIL